MLFMNKTLLRLARGLWLWILAIAGVSFLTLVGTTALAEIIAGFLGSLFEPQEALSSAGSAIRGALVVALFTFCAQMGKGLLEYKTAAEARTSMRRMIFSRVLELDAGGIEKIGPVSAITASVDAVEQMQMYFSTYLPSLICSILAPVYLFFHLKNISMPVALLLLAVSLVLLPVNNLFRCRIEEIRKIYWKSLDDMTGYYMDSLRGLTTLKLFDRDQEHSRVLGEKADILNYNINCFMKVNFTSFLVTEAMIYAAILFALVNSAGRIADGSMTIAQALIVLMLSYSYFSSAKELMNASHSALTAIAAAGKVEEILDTDTSRPYDPSLPADPEYFEHFRETFPENGIVGIPIHGYDAVTHDGITRAKGSFQQTMTGLKRLMGTKIRIELRIVVSRLNLDFIQRMAEMIAKELPGVYTVKFIGLEMLGNARLNRELVWVDYKTSFRAVQESIRYLVLHGINVGIYNYPLCCVDRSFWPLCERSITDYKVRYLPECDACRKKDACGGMFQGTYRWMEGIIEAIR